MILSNGWATRATIKISSLEGIHDVSNRDPLTRISHIYIYTGEPIPATHRSWYSILHHPPLFLPRPSFLILASDSAGFAFIKQRPAERGTLLSTPPFLLLLLLLLFLLFSFPFEGSRWKWRMGKMDFDVALSRVEFNLEGIWFLFDIVLNAWKMLSYQNFQALIKPSLN